MTGVPRGGIDSGRVHFFGHSLQVLGQFGGFHWARVHSDYSVSVCSYNGRVTKVPGAVLCSQDRRFAFLSLEAAAYGREVAAGEMWFMNQVDKEFFGLVKSWEK